MGNHNGIPRICWLIFVATKTEVFTRTGSGSTGKKSKHWLSTNITIEKEREREKKKRDLVLLLYAHIIT